jgi:flavin reductase (DIM6/NTAB) family NADH-FMN oxidoreductase RutF
MAADGGQTRDEHSFSPQDGNDRAFRDALGRFTTGVTVVTAPGPIGMTVNSFTGLSLDPALILWSPAKSSSRHDAFVQNDHFALHVLALDQVAFCKRFTRGGAGFDGLPFDLNAHDVPLLHDTLARFECTVAARHDAGDHTIIVGKVARVTTTEGEALCFAQGRYGRFSPVT